jgi:uncharacterized membrane protein
MRLLMVWSLFALFAVAAVSTASACPVCNTGTGEQVRAGLFDESFGMNLLATVLPFPILLGFVAAIHFGWPRRKSRSSTAATAHRNVQ